MEKWTSVVTHVCLVFESSMKSEGVRSGKEQEVGGRGEIKGFRKTAESGKVRTLQLQK